jgi:hypothetical protein
MSSKRIYQQPDIDLLFKNAADGGGGSKVNPITGGHYVPGLDCIKRQKMLAQRAHFARYVFAMEGPPDAQPLPLTPSEREDFKNAYLHPDRIHYIVSLIAGSLAALDYAYDKHPSWHEFACGVMASPYAPPDYVLDKVEFSRRYPPRDLPGLGPGCCWDPAYLRP